MLRGVKELLGYKLKAADGNLGKVRDFYFDDESWTVRYLVADTKRWLPGRLVLISPKSLGRPKWAAHLFPVSLDKKQIEHGPAISQDQPVSRQQESRLSRYYGWSIYWGASLSYGAPPMAPAALAMLDDEGAEDEKEGGQDGGDQHLRSVREVTGYKIQAKDGEIGRVEDFIVDDDNWILRYLVVNTRNWMPGGRKVVLSPGWAQRVEWESERVVLDLKRETIERAPEYNPGDPVNREVETRLYDYYGRPVYWSQDRRMGPNKHA